MFDLAPYAKQVLLYLVFWMFAVTKYFAAGIDFVTLAVLLIAQAYALNEYFKINSLSRSFGVIISAYLISFVPMIALMFFGSFLRASILVGSVFNWVYSSIIDFLVISWRLNKLNKGQVAMFAVVSNFVFVAVVVLVSIWLKTMDPSL